MVRLQISGVDCLRQTAGFLAAQWLNVMHTICLPDIPQREVAADSGQMSAPFNSSLRRRRSRTTSTIYGFLERQFGYLIQLCRVIQKFPVKQVILVAVVVAGPTTWNSLPRHLRDSVCDISVLTHFSYQSQSH